MTIRLNFSVHIIGLAVLCGVYTADWNLHVHLHVALNPNNCDIRKHDSETINYFCLWSSGI